MIFCIDAAVLGTKKHLVVDGEQFSFIDEIPRDIFHFSGNVKYIDDNCLDSLFKLSGIEIVSAPPEKYVKMMQVLSPELVNPPWSKIMPLEAHRSFAKLLVGTIQGNIRTSNLEYFVKTWVHGNSLLKQLSVAKIDVDAVRSYIEASDGNIAALRTFLEPKIPTYDRFGTRTGRMTIFSGPDVLTLKKEQRSVLKSSFGENGKIMNIDFSAIEVRALLYEAGGFCEVDDLYADFAEKLFLGKYSRKVVKAAVICALYGASKKELAKKLNVSPVDLVKLTNRLKAHLNVNELKERLKKEYIYNKSIKNFYGKSLKIEDPSDHILLNSYAQSTGVDIAMVGFNRLVSEIDLDRCRPLFVLHDALIVDVHNDYESELRDKKWVDVSGYSQKFALAVT